MSIPSGYVVPAGFVDANATIECSGCMGTGAVIARGVDAAKYVICCVCRGTGSVEVITPA